jgi:hypothetical protein
MERCFDALRDREEAALAERVLFDDDDDDDCDEGEDDTEDEREDDEVDDSDEEEGERLCRRDLEWLRFFPCLSLRLWDFPREPLRVWALECLRFLRFFCFSELSLRETRFLFVPRSVGLSPAGSFSLRGVSSRNFCVETRRVSSPVSSETEPLSSS